MCLDKLAKIFLTVINVAFVLCGLVLALLGAAARFKLGLLKGLLFYIQGIKPILEMMQMFDFSGSLDLLNSISLTMMILGAALFAMGFLGCFGAYCNSKCSLLLFAIFLLTLLLAQIVVIAWYLIDSDSFTNALTGELKTVMTANYKGSGLAYNSTGYLSISTNSLDQSIDYLQVGVGCCGSSGPEDWADAGDWDNNYTLPGNIMVYNATVPLSCCVVDDSSKYPLKTNEMTFTNAADCLENGYSDSPGVQTQGCVDAMASAMKTYGKVTLGVIAGIMALEILEIVCSCHLRKEMDKNSPV